MTNAEVKNGGWPAGLDASIARQDAAQGGMAPAAFAGRSAADREFSPVKTQDPPSNGYAAVRASLASLLGSTIEWYDFFLYGAASALVFNHVFFPKLGALSGTIAAFGTYGLGFVVRPLGALAFGHFGDRLGRKTVLLASLLAMGLPTVLIGLLPSYDAIGYLAPLLLIVLRCVQGFAVGGEWGAVILAVEHASPRFKGLLGGLSQTGVAAGLTLSSLAMAAVSASGHDEMLRWAWRIPFIGSGLLVVVGWLLRRKVDETPEFASAKQQGRCLKYPVGNVFQDHAGALLSVAGARVAEISFFYIVTAFTLWYATKQLGLPEAWCLNGVTLGAAAATFLMPLCGMLGDRWGARRIYIAGIVTALLWILPFFMLVNTRTMVWVVFAEAVSVVLSFSMAAQQASLFVQQFPVIARYTGASLAVNIAGALGGLAPIVATTLLGKTQGGVTCIAGYVAALAVISVASALRLKRV
ncbi:MFS transporter (plasmid) [Ralstonia syzygii]|uniref:MFS transporter n=1 Tax=Ralstonia syzygii TaxID=28097 RepID=A0ABX7ZP21_9RALS|nr:MFS transporter [Ralstonia syzygii]QUP56915.1 MFS transporter [Ralstonia syzygii]